MFIIILTLKLVQGLEAGVKRESSLSNDEHYLLIDKTYEDEGARTEAQRQGFIPIVPPKSNRKESWLYDKQLYKSRNEIEHYFLRLKCFRKIFTRYDKLDVLFLEVIDCAIAFDAISMLTRSSE